MKKIFLSFLLSILLFPILHAQIVIQSTTATTTIVEEPKKTKEWFISWRGDASLALIVAEGIGGTLNFSNGIQIHPRIWLGGVLGISLGGHALAYYPEHHIAPKVKIFLYKQPRNRWMPYLSASTGFCISEYYGFYADLIFGFTHYNTKRTMGIAPFVGISYLGGVSNFPIFCNLGVNFEFGRTSGFKERP